MSSKKYCLRVLVIALTGSFVTSAALASVDRSPPPGGVYRLKPGIYVAKGTSCGNAPFAAIRKYDGIGISDPHSHACRAKVLSRRGSTFVVSQSCIDAGVGAAPRVVERQTVGVQDALTFSIATRGPKTVYRYCPASMLPKGIR